MIKSKLLLLLLFAITFHTFSQDNIIINSGHSYPVQNFSSANNQLFTCDNRGTLMVWDIAKKTLTKKIQTSYLQIRNMAVNYDGTRVAIVETDTISSFKLSVWDLQNDKKLFSHKMEELPLFIKFSPKGSYIVYSNTDWNSLTFLDSEKGFEVPLMFDNYGIVSSTFITDSEKTLMFYSPSGTIQYWNLLNGKIKTEPIRTRKDLSSIEMTEDGAYMTASDNNNLYLISLRSGKTLYSIKTSGIISSAIINNSKELVLLQKNNNKFKINIWKIITTQGNEILQLVNTIELPSNIVTGSGFTIIDNLIYLSGTQGQIISINISSKKASIFSENIMGNISDLKVLDGILMLATDKNIFTLKTDIFINTENLKDKPIFEVESHDNPFLEETGIVSDNYNFYLYPKSGTKGELKKFNSGLFTTFSTDFSSSIISAEYNNGKFITLEKDGSIQIINSYTGEQIFKYSSFGINSIESVFGNNLIVGRNRTTFLKSPLLHINPASEEVVPIKESNIIIFKMDYDNITRTLYTLGFEERKSGLITVLKAHTGSSWELTDTIMTYPGEDQAGSFVVDESKSRIYLSIGNSGLIMYGWNGFTDMQNTNHLPKTLYVYEDILISLNTDSSLSFWNTLNGKFLLNFYLLKNGEWITVSDKKEVTFSKESLNYLIN